MRQLFCNKPKYRFRSAANIDLVSASTTQISKSTTMPSICVLSPSRLSIMPVPRKQSAYERWSRGIDNQFKISIPSKSLLNLQEQKKSFKLSNQSKRKVYDTINLLYTLSKPRTVKMRSGKSIYNFRCAFITLTLPATQAHEDTQIKSDCLNQFLIELRKAYKIENYFWKAELQKNENIHFHLLVDQYCDFQALRRRWNRVINKLGYVDAYSKKFDQMQLSEIGRAHV